jgi:hypothetical protein
MEIEARRCSYLLLVVGVKRGPKSGVAMANAFCNSSSIKNCRIVCLYWNDKELSNNVIVVMAKFNDGRRM